MKKKTVEAPRSYNPGKGRPKEYLAYLNYQEMEALKRLNGNNQERGPKGLPSFPPADSRSGSYNSGYGSAASKTTSKTTTKSPSSATASISRTTSNVARSPASQGSPVSQRPTSGPLSAPARTAPSQGSPVSQRTTTPARQGSPVSQRPSGGARDSGQAAARSDTAFKQAAERKSAASARNTPALRQDQNKTISAGPMGTPVRTGVPSKQAQRIVPRATITTPMATQGVSFTSPIDARRSIAFAGQTRVPSVSEIAAENARRLNAAKAAQYSAQMAQQYSQYRSPPGTYPTAPQGVFGPRVGEGAGYLRTQTTPGMFTYGADYGVPTTRQVGGPEGFYATPTSSWTEYSGTEVPPMTMRQGFSYPPADPRRSAESTLRAYEAGKLTIGQKPIQDRIPGSKLYDDRVPQEPRLTVGRSTVVPSYPTTAPSGSIYDRPGRDPAVERALAEAGFDPTGRRLEPMIDPSIPGRIAQTKTPPVYTPGKVYYDRLLPDMPNLAGRSRIPFTGGPERILEIEDYAGISDSGIRKPISGFAAPAALPGKTRGISDLSGVPEESVPGSQIDVTNIPRVPTVILPSPEPEPSGERLLDGRKIYTDPFADRVPAEDVSGGSFVPSVVVNAPGGTVAYPNVEAIAPPPSTPKKSQDRILTFFSPDGRQRYSMTSEQFNSLSQEDRNKLAQYAAQGQPATPPKPRPKPTSVTRSISAPAQVPIPRPKPKSYSEGDIDEADTSFGQPEGTEVPEVDYVDGVDTSTTDGDFNAPPSQGGLTEKQRKEAEKKVKKGGLVIKIGGAVVSVVTGLPVSLGGRYLSKKYQESKLKQLENYAAMTSEQKAVAEARNPELIGWAKELNIPSVNDYSVYQAWATERGLRAPEGGGKNSGILALGGGSSGGGTTPTPETPSTPSTPSGRRPDIYYMWDLGVNIPSPSDPNYTQYQAYLAERLAAQQAMGYV